MHKNLHSLQYIAATRLILNDVNTSRLPKLLRDYLDSIKCLYYWYSYTDLHRDPYDYFDDHNEYDECTVYELHDWLINSERTLAFYNHLHRRICLKYPGGCGEELLARFDLHNFHFDGRPIIDYSYVYARSRDHRP